MTYVPSPSAPADYISEHRLYDAVMARIDLDLVGWNYQAFKFHLLTLPPEEQKRLTDAKHVSLMEYRKHLVRLEQSLSGHEQGDAKNFMQTSGEISTLDAIEDQLTSL
ncbi:hypothetical protein COW46_04030 [Candidatus Gracilibacteria bacterium CG17_big_fil_post_rev_8_21_14_2_50_48_13]|nr:MAG: hypothetical protein COW46_04030 [Candidatus Gracilibacteria bacterium CG17_big_fil_post_rev_8_21_14_2_50_48_13]